jgi:hypothetical protein
MRVKVGIKNVKLKIQAINNQLIIVSKQEQQ